LHANRNRARLSTIRNGRIILVLDDGRIVEQGSQELLDGMDIMPRWAQSVENRNGWSAISAEDRCVRPGIGFLKPCPYFISLSSFTS